MSYLILFNETKYISDIRYRYFDWNSIEKKWPFHFFRHQIGIFLRHTATFNAILVIEDLLLYFCGQIKVIIPVIDRELWVSCLQDHQMDFFKIRLMTYLPILVTCFFISIFIIRYYQIRCTLKPPLKAASFVEVEQRQGYGSGKPSCTLANMNAIFNLFSA